MPAPRSGSGRPRARAYSSARPTRGSSRASTRRTRAPAFTGSRRSARWRLFAAVNSPRRRFPVVVRLLKALAVELVEVDAVGLVSDQEIEHRPDQREAALFAGEAAHHLGAAFDLAEGALEQVC